MKNGVQYHIVLWITSLFGTNWLVQLPSVFEEDEELAVLEAPELAMELNAPSVFVGDVLAFCHWLLS